MIKAGIIGCGKIADQHADEIKRIPGCELVGVCDSEELMAKQLFERFGAKQYYSDVRELLDKARPDVVHITTPTQSHFELGKMCLEAGCNVYIEKPFTIDTAEAEALIKLATQKNLKITAGHNAQFTLAARRMREIVHSGYLGGPPLHIDCYYCYNLGDPSYAKALLGDKNHWVRRMPGKLLQNIISHGISKIAEFIAPDSPKIIAHGFTSQVLKSIGEDTIIDEVRVIIHDNVNTTAYFTFSSQMRPVLHQLRLYGPKNALIQDDDNQTVVKVRGEKYKSYLDHFVPPLVFAREYFSNSVHNVKKFAKRELHMNEGMRYLINAFYKSIAENSPPPISYREIILTSRIMDTIFKQVQSN